MRLALSLLVVLTAWLGATPSTARACSPSPSGAYSFELSLARSAGVLCMGEVRVFRGAQCQGEAVLATLIGCGESSRIAVTDEGALVTVAAPRASRRSWAIVRIVEREETRAVARSVRLDDLPETASLGARPWLRLEAGSLVLVAGSERVVISLTRARGALAPRPRTAQPPEDDDAER